MRLSSKYRSLYEPPLAAQRSLYDQVSGATAAGVWPLQQQQKPIATGLKASFQVTHSDGSSCGNDVSSGCGSDGTLRKPHHIEAGPLRPVLTLHNHIYNGDIEGYNEAFREVSRKDNLSQLLNVLQTHDERVGVRL